MELIMATIQRVKNKKGYSYRAIVRNIGLKEISKTFPNRQLANQFIYKMESDRQARALYDGRNSDKLFYEIANEYLKYEYRGSRPKQQKSMTNFWLESLGDTMISDITSSDIERGLEALPSVLSNATKNRYKAVVSVIFSYAIRRYGLTHNPVQNIRSMRENNHRVRYLSDNERKRLYEACRVSKWTKLYLVVLMAITTGARKGELTHLRWSNIDLEMQTASVETTKNGLPKVMPLTDEVMAELERFIGQESELIFNSEIKTNKPYEFNKLWKKALKSAQIEDFRFHDLRHTTASYLAQNGATLLEIADVLGHKQISVTKRYAHLCITHKTKLINRVMRDI